MRKIKDYKLKVNILDFGAKSGEEKLQTEYIQSAIDYCFKMGGGEIQIPNGEFLTGGIRLRSNTILHLLEGAKLIGSRNPEDYFALQNDKVEPVPKNILEEETRVNGRSLDGIHYGRRWCCSLIKIYNAKNVGIIGEENSIIDGRDCYDALGEEGFRGPHCICIGESKNLYFHGYTIINSANWAHSIWNCKNIHCDGIRVLGGHDGFDFFGSRNVLVENSTLHTGDDCIAGYANYKVIIRNNNMSSACSAFRFAGTDVLIENCVVNGNSKYVHRYTCTEQEKITGKLLSDEENPNHRYRMKSFYTYYGDNRLIIKKQPSKIKIKNCKISNAVKLFHYNYSGSEFWSINRPLADVSLVNLDVDNVSLPMVAYGDKDVKFKIDINNVKIKLSDDYADDCLVRAANLKRVNLNNLKVENFNGYSVIKNYGKNEGKILLENTDFGKVNIKSVTETDEEFLVESI